MMEIADLLGFSLHKVAYWMNVYQIPRRSISEAIYVKRYPNGDPFCVRPILTQADAELLGLGLGLCWLFPEPNSIKFTLQYLDRSELI